MLMSVTVGVRKFRENLSHYLDRAKGGEEVIVTERGKPVVRLGSYKPDKLWELVAQGRARPPLRPRTPIAPEAIIKVDGPSLIDTLLEDRGP